VQVRTAHALEAGKAHELWILPAPDVNNGNPVSLGLLPTSGEQKLTLTAAQRAALAGAKQLAVSLEPAGGSPTGLPTGPVLHVAPLKTA
jgi:anti-sigma-K factor RskA